jgi:GAF domain-containing protein
MKNEVPQEAPEDSTYLILERPDKRAKRLTLTASFVKLIRRLLSPLYQESSLMQECFGPGMRDERISASDINSLLGYQDPILEGMANMIIRLGGKTANGQNHWRFCTILMPDTAFATLPLQQRTLVTRAQSDDSPYIVGQSPVSPEKSKTSLSIRAFQSGRVIYRPELSSKDRTPVFVGVEGPIRSNIAIPIGSESGSPVAALYVASDERGAFSKEDQQLLRIMARFIENTLNTYTSRLQVSKDLRSLMRTPEVVDTFFAEFLSENDFMRHLESLLADPRSRSHTDLEEEQEDASDAEKGLQESDDDLSFIALDIDDQESLANRYGDQLIRHLNKTVGLRIQEYITSLVTRSASCQLYYMFTDRFYLILQGFSLDKAREIAVKLQRSLSGNISLKPSEVSDSILIIPDIKVHLAVGSYRRKKLNQMLEEYASVVDISTKISQELDVGLKQGLDEGGNVIISFDPAFATFRRWKPAEQ